MKLTLVLTLIVQLVVLVKFFCKVFYHIVKKGKVKIEIHFNLTSQKSIKSWLKVSKENGRPSQLKVQIQKFLENNQNSIDVPDKTKSKKGLKYRFLYFQRIGELVFA